MELLKIIGIGLIGLSALSGIAIYIDTFGLKLNITALSWLFIFSLIGGASFYCLGVRNLLGIVYVSYILLLLGCLSAVTIFLAEISLFDNEKKGTLWVFFLICTPIGAIGIYHQEILSFLVLKNIIN